MATEQQAGQQSGTSTRATREQVIADLDRMASGGAAESPKETPAAEPEAEEPAEENERQEPAEEPTEPAEEPAAEAGKDPDLDKRLAIVAKQEKRARDQLEKQRLAIEQERAAVRRERDAIDRELQSARAEIQAFNEIKARAKYDPAGVLRSLGLSEDDLGPASRQLWAHTKENLADPKNREAAARLMQEREREDRIAKLERELAESRKAAEQEKAQAATAREIESYLDGITKAIKEEHALARRLVEKAPELARQRFAQIAYELGERDNELPDADDVIAEYEKRRRAELEIDGIEWAAKPKAKPKSEPAPTTLGNDVGTRTAPAGSNGASKKSLAEKKAELEAELRAMDLKSQ